MLLLNPRAPCHHPDQGEDLMVQDLIQVVQEVEVEILQGQAAEETIDHYSNARDEKNTDFNTDFIFGLCKLLFIL